MHAMMMHLAIFLPDWNSLDSVRRAHNDCEGAALIFFALLVVSEAFAHLAKGAEKKHAFDTLGIIFFAIAVLAEIAAYPYGQRNDTLSEQIIGSLDVKAKDASDNAALALTNSGKALGQAAQADLHSGNAQKKAEAVGKEADKANARAAELEQANIVLKAKMAPRRVSGKQAEELCPEIHVDGRRLMDIASSAGTSETDDFAEDIGRAIVNCQHGLSVHLHKQVLIEPLPIPFRIAYAPSRKADAQMLSDAMVKAHIAAKAIEMIPAPDADQHPDALRLFVGPKPPEP